MEMHQVRYFLAVAEEKNFTRASEKCNVTQPSLSRAVKRMRSRTTITINRKGLTPASSGGASRTFPIGCLRKRPLRSPQPI
jgi:hypothetical protein